MPSMAPRALQTPGGASAAHTADAHCGLLLICKPRPCRGALCRTRCRCLLCVAQERTSCAQRGSHAEDLPVSRSMAPVGPGGGAAASAHTLATHAVLCIISSRPVAPPRPRLPIARVYALHSACILHLHRTPRHAACCKALLHAGFARMALGPWPSSVPQNCACD